jgi:hypothetical protein
VSNSLYNYHTHPQSLYGFDKRCRSSTRVECGEGEYDVEVLFLRGGVLDRSNGPARLLYKVGGGDFLHTVFLSWYMEGKHYVTVLADVEERTKQDLGHGFSSSPPTIREWPFDHPTPTYATCEVFMQESLPEGLSLSGVSANGHYWD